MSTVYIVYFSLWKPLDDEGDSWNCRDDVYKIFDTEEKAAEYIKNFLDGVYEGEEGGVIYNDVEFKRWHFPQIFTKIEPNCAYLLGMNKCRIKLYIRYRPFEIE